MWKHLPLYSIEQLAYSVIDLIVEFNDIGKNLVEKEISLPTPEKEEIHATRISPSNLEVVYPFLDNLLLYSNEENVNPLLVVSVSGKKQDYINIRNSFQGTCLHTAQMLSLVFCRHSDRTSVDDLKDHFPTYPENGLEIMSFFGNKATAKATGADRIFKIYQQYHDAQKGLLKGGLHLSESDVLSAWNDPKTEDRVRKYISTIYYLFNTNQLKVSNPQTIMQFEVSLIPRFDDLMLQCPMSIDMIVKAPHEAAHMNDFKKGQFPELNSEISLHQRYLMDATARNYIYSLENNPPLYFGSPIVNGIKSSAPSQYGALDFFYTTDRFNRDSGGFEYQNATIGIDSLWSVYYSLFNRAELINDNKKLVRRYLSLHKHMSPIPNIPSVFEINPKEDKNVSQSLSTLV